MVGPVKVKALGLLQLRKQHLERGLWLLCRTSPPPVGPGWGGMGGAARHAQSICREQSHTDGSPRWPTCPFPAPLSGAGLGMSPSRGFTSAVCCRACGRVVGWPSPLSPLPAGAPRSAWRFESRAADSAASVNRPATSV